MEDLAVGKTFIPIYDGNGNVGGLLDRATGDFEAAYEYSPYGEVLRRSGTYRDNPFGFSTKYTDRETELVYYGLRYYSPSLGRFINRDPAGEGGGLNLYAFVNNDPMNQVDFLGLTGIAGINFSFSVGVSHGSYRGVFFVENFIINPIVDSIREGRFTLEELIEVGTEILGIVNAVREIIEGSNGGSEDGDGGTGVGPGGIRVAIPLPGDRERRVFVDVPLAVFLVKGGSSRVISIDFAFEKSVIKNVVESRKAIKAWQENLWYFRGTIRQCQLKFKTAFGIVVEAHPLTATFDIKVPNDNTVDVSGQKRKRSIINQIALLGGTSRYQVGITNARFIEGEDGPGGFGGAGGPAIISTPSASKYEFILSHEMGHVLGVSYESFSKTHSTSKTSLMFQKASESLGQVDQEYCNAVNNIDK